MTGLRRYVFIRDCPLGFKPLPTSPCQGRRGFGSPPDKGELEGVLSLSRLMGDSYSWQMQDTADSGLPDGFCQHLDGLIAGETLAPGQRDTPRWGRFCERNDLQQPAPIARAVRRSGKHGDAQTGGDHVADGFQRRAMLNIRAFAA